MSNRWTTLLVALFAYHFTSTATANPDVLEITPGEGKINGDRERVLLQRFGADAFPTIYVLSGSSAWKYEGNRNLESIKDFAFQGRLKTDAMERPPHGFIGSLIGKAHKLVKAMKSQYSHLREEHEWSNFTIIMAVLAVPVVVDGTQLHVAPRQE
ncbi:hypothetical protein DUNSADRAFT_15308 [Dunaliella salina]|uniref:Uncharacterized protein n=1 Tax=Dunaliella salina TaxID=3046 RepID=A0ABQ7G5P2_DUNSA|nr:hypothetical protein DUNSADRAFT_15308 [Dunaliella salina]|eukprot:KAF5829928.1 hypothetical protein DUNSADRAFT_15308 [Dunaliella salina]